MVATKTRRTPFKAKRALRVRFTPVRYRPSPPAAERYRSPELKEMDEAMKIMRAQLRGNQTLLEDTAAYFGCALTAQKPRKVPVTPNGIQHERPVPCPWLGAQAKKLAVADDGHYYDFSHITQYILDNVHRQLRSPRTGEPMGSQVYYVGKCKTKKKPKTLIWTPPIFHTPLPESDSDSDVEEEPAAAPETIAVD